MLAVTYPAREFGIKRGDSWEAVASKSKNQCIAIHLPIISIQQANKEKKETEEGDTTTKGGEGATVAAAAVAGEGDKAAEDDKDSDNNHDDSDSNNHLGDEEEFQSSFHMPPAEQQRCLQTENGVRRFHQDGKASLERYRLASRVIFKQVLQSLKKHVKQGFILEKASIDEFFLDITEYCYGTSESEQVDEETSGNSDGVERTKVIGEQQQELGDLGDDSADTDSADDVEAALRRACEVSSWIRNDVWENLGFTMSAGVSTNKMMAKLAASFGKPNGQAVLFPKDFSHLMAQTKVRKVRNFGGKLGKRVLDLLYLHSCSKQSKVNFTDTATMSDLAQLSLPDLQNTFSAGTAQFVFQACQGTDDEPVKETSGALVKSITAFKSFTASKNKTEVHDWLRLLAKEITERVAQDAARNHRYPKSCTLNYTYYTTSNGKRPRDGTSSRTQQQTRSYRLNFPPERSSLPTKSEFLVAQAMTKLAPILKEHLLRGVGLAAGNFESRGQPPVGNASIESFFSVASKTNAAESAQQPRETKEKPPSVLLDKKSERKPETFSSNKRSRSGFSSFFSVSMPEEPQAAQGTSERSPSPSANPESSSETVDADLEMAKKLQASFDRENYVFSKVNQRRVGTTNKTATKKATKQPKTKKIDSFFTRR